MKCGGCAVDDDAGDAAKEALLQDHADVVIVPPAIRTGSQGLGQGLGQSRRARSEAGDDCKRRSVCSGSPSGQHGGSRHRLGYGPGHAYGDIGGSEGNFASCLEGQRKRSSLAEPRWSSLKETSVNVAAAGEARANGAANIMLQPPASEAKAIGKEVTTSASSTGMGMGVATTGLATVMPTKEATTGGARRRG